MIRELKQGLYLLGLAVLFWLFSADYALAAHTHSYTAGPHYESTHKAGGHREYYSCYAWDGATKVTGNYSTMSGCSQCYPPAHNCTPSSTWTDSHANNHAKYRFKCSSSSCPKGNNSVGEYMGNASWSWRNVSGLGGHTSSGHAQYRECSYCGYEEVRGYTSDPNCSTCYPPHTHSWVNSGSPSSSHTSSGHAQIQRCGCGSTRTVYVATLSGCTTCYPHTCTPGSAWTDSAHPHARWYYACTVSSCTKGNYNKKVSAGGNAAWGWVNEPGTSEDHVSQGHAFYHHCSYCGFQEVKGYKPIVSCAICFPPYYEAIVHNYYDRGYPARYDETDAEAENSISEYLDDVADRYMELFRLHLTFDTQYFNSVADQCKGTVTSANIDILCTCSGEDHTELDYGIAPDFRERITGGNPTTTLAYWSAHRITSSRGENRSLSNGTNIYMIAVSSPALREQETLSTLFHELNHQYGALDHYHEQTDPTDVTTCKRSIYNGGTGYCSNQYCNNETGTISRPSSCIMNYALDIAASDILCASCLLEMEAHLEDHH